MNYWYSISNKQPTKISDYYVVNEAGEVFKCKWTGKFDDNVVGWLEPVNNQTADEAYEEFVETIVDMQLNRR